LRTVQLPPGTRFGPYEIVAPVAEGGMGEVYRAIDTRLDRVVALKVLPSHLSSDPELRRRFEREARAISSLSHPNICTLFDVGQHEGLEYLVMEYLEGKTLGDRLMQGPLPMEELYRYGMDIADALEKAHREGIVHRDLKPGNIVLTDSGAKLLDFGLAKWMPEDDHSFLAPGDQTTRRQPITTAGTLLGTVPYMAPEQLEGKPVDARSDIFSFGAILYEMATGVRAFNATSNASLIAALIHDDPIPPSRIRTMPPRFDAIVQTCLRKDPNDRFQSAHDIRLELQWLASGTPDTLPGTKPRTAWLIAFAGLAAIVALAALVVAFARRSPAQDVGKSAIRFTVPPPPGSDFPSLGEGGGIALSPDGRQLAFIAIGGDGRSFLWLRGIDSTEPKLLAGTEGALYPFWSPDSRSVAFFAGGKLKRMLVPDGAAQTICDAAGGRGGTWNSAGTIVFAPGSSTALWRVPAGGGQAMAITSVDNARYSHRWPVFLPDGNHFLYMAQSQEPMQQGIYAASLDAPNKVKRVTASSGSAAFAPPHELLYVRDGVLVRQRLDLDKLELTGDPQSIADRMVFYVDRAYVPVTASDDGVIAYQRKAVLNMRIAWYDRRGERLGMLWDPGENEGLSLSPDGTKLAFGHFEPEEGLNHIWIADTADGVPRRFSFTQGNQYSPVWSPDGQRVVYSDDHSGVETLTENLATGGNERALTLQPPSSQYALSWSPDGQTLLYRTESKDDGLDIETLSGKQAAPFIATRADESQGQFSPDGRYVVYVSTESGRNEVYVQPYPKTGAKWQVSTSGGEQPRWRRDGAEIFYLGPDKRLMSAALRRGPQFDAATPQPLFTTTMFVGYLSSSQAYDVTRDGSKFVIASIDPQTPPSPITVVVTR
jgi:serine/threonine protein kinase/Tol biopolymer transport system component